MNIRTDAELGWRQWLFMYWFRLLWNPLFHQRAQQRWAARKRKLKL